MTANFDEYSQAYEELLDKSTRLFGEPGRYFAKLKAEYIARTLGSDFSGKLLDYGCGIGLLSECIARTMPNVVLHGFDVSAASIQKIPQNLKEQRLFTPAVEELDGNYDVIVVANVMHHVPRQQRQEVLASVKARLAPNGCSIVFEHNPLNPLTRWAVHQCPLDEDAVLLWPRELIRYLRAVGFPTIDTDYITFFPKSLAGLRRFESLLRWCPLGGQYAMVAGSGGWRYGSSAHPQTPSRRGINRR